MYNVPKSFSILYVVISLQQYTQMTSELELLRTLAEAEEDVEYFALREHSVRS